MGKSDGSKTSSWESTYSFGKQSVYNLFLFTRRQWPVLPISVNIWIAGLENRYIQNLILHIFSFGNWIIADENRINQLVTETYRLYFRIYWYDTLYGIWESEQIGPGN